MAFAPITTVYSYRMPEVRRTIDHLLEQGFPHEVFLRSVAPPGALDGFHEPIIDKVLEFYRAEVPALAGFVHRYPTAGSEEGIREIMTRLQAEGQKRIYMLTGDYEGYRAVAEQRCMQAIDVEPGMDPRRLEPGTWFISNPSAIDGNLLPDGFVQSICEAGHQVFYDLAYLGSTRPYTFDLSHPNIFAAVISFSKTYGLFYDRIGFTFSRTAVPSLYGNKWFKAILGLLIAQAIVSELRPGQLHRTYGRAQALIVDQLNRTHGLGLRPSDTFLLGYLTQAQAEALGEDGRKLIRPYQRGRGYRFCLTPCFVERDPDFGNHGRSPAS